MLFSYYTGIHFEKHRVVTAKNMPPKGRGRKGSTSDAGTAEEVVVGTFETLRDEGEHFVHVQQFEKAIESFTKVKNV